MLALRLTRFEHLVDLNHVSELSSVERDNGTLVVGAMARQCSIERNEVAQAVPLLTRAIPLIGHFQIRNRGTVGGSIAHADPAGELPAIALALDAEMEIASSGGTRRVEARDFFAGTWTTTIEPDELLVAIRFPVWSGRCGFAIDEVARRMGDFALTGVGCGVELDDAGAVRRAAISLLGMGPTPLRADAAEAALVGTTPVAADLSAAAELAVRDLDPPVDVHASAAYRTSVGAHVVERALSSALEEARGG